MHAERLIKILAANPNPDPTEAELTSALVMSDSPPRDLDAEAELLRALVRSGGDGMTACGEDAGLCPKPRLRHRRVNVGVWPNWRCVHVEWPIKGGRLCRSQEFANRYPFNTCGTHQDHIDHEELKRKTANYLQHCLNQEPEPIMTADRWPFWIWNNRPKITDLSTTEPEVKASGTPRTGPSWQSKIIPDH